MSEPLNEREKMEFVRHVTGILKETKEILLIMNSEENKQRLENWLVEFLTGGPQ